MRTVLKTIIRFIHLDPEGINGRIVRRLPPLFLLAVSLLPVGCTLAGEDSADSPARTSVSGDAVAFSVSGSGLTRTAEGTEDLSSLRSGSGFGVFAAHHGIHPYASSNIVCDFMWNQQVTYDAPNGVWTYSPVKYWPAGDGTEENKEYLTFFAYAPYTEPSADGCVTDFSKSGEAGDPWLVYQLGGTRDDWQSSQVDQLWAFTKDQQKDNPLSRVSFSFRHALATAGDAVTMRCSDILQTRLKGAARAAGADVRIVLDALTLNYALVRKGKLILNGSDTPNWQALDSGDALVHRVVEFTPASPFTLARATDGGWIETASSLTGFADQGVFYIPLELKGHPQKVDISAEYSVKTGDDVTYRGVVGTTIALDSQVDAGHRQDFRLVFQDNLPLEGTQDQSVFLRILDIADQTYTGADIEPAVTVVSSDGRVLTQGTDFTLAYDNNVNAALSTGSQAPTVTATGTGDYQGGIATKAFTILKATATFAYPVIAMTKTTDDTTFTNSLTNTGNGAVTYSSSDEAVATVVNTGIVTIVGVGTCIITATVDPDTDHDYPITTAQYSLTVTAAVP